MSLIAFLPWERWIGPLVHPAYVAARKNLFLIDRQRLLAVSARWTEIEGKVQSIKWDSSLPREEVTYSYVAESGYYAGSYWNWFAYEGSRETRPGDLIRLRYKPDDPARSVFVSFLKNRWI